MEIKINLTSGTLKDRIPLSRIAGITSLSIIGSINGDDIEFIRSMAGGYESSRNKPAGPLEFLDLSKANLISGGLYKHTEYMGFYKNQMTLIQFMDMMSMKYVEAQGSGYGLFLHNSNEISDEMFLGCYRLKTLILPNLITRIGHLAFYNCPNLESIYLGDQIISIGDFAFEETLNEIHIRCITPPQISRYTFGDPNYRDLSKITLFVPKGCTSDYWLQWGLDNIIEE